jgi:hypothetical protein
MQTLGLASAPQPSDGMFKRLFWPTIQNAYDVDLVGQQGFWVCVAIAVLSAAVLVVTAHPLIGLLVAATYVLGGIGVRERSISAAVLVFLGYLIDKIATALVQGVGNPLIGLVALMLLFANVRATVLSKRWHDQDSVAAAEEMPERLTTSFTDKLANQMPARIWPKMKFVFFPIASILLLLQIIGIVGIAAMHRVAPPQ